MRAHARWIIVLVALVLGATSTSAQSASGPEPAARHYFGLMQKADWDGAAAAMHPDALQEFKSLFESFAAHENGVEVISQFFGVKTAAEFKALPPAEVYARLMRSLVSMSDEMRQAMTSVKAEIIGSVAEGPDVAHVVYRMNMGVADVSIAKVQVLSFRRSGDRWLGLLTGDIRGLAQQLSRMGARR